MYSQRFEFESPLIGGRFLQDELAQRDQKLRAAIQNTPRSAIEAITDESAYIADLVLRSTIPVPQIDFEHIQKSERYEKVHGSRLAGEVIFPDRMYDVLVVTFSLEGTGDLNLLRYAPLNNVPLSYPQLTLRGNTFSFEVSSVSKNLDRMKQEKETTLSFLRDRLAALLPEIEKYNQALEGNITRLFEHKKESIRVDKALLDQL